MGGGFPLIWSTRNGKIVINTIEENRRERKQTTLHLRIIERDMRGQKPIKMYNMFRGIHIPTYIHTYFVIVNCVCVSKADF